ncbi:MAG: UDP-N-acetylglucosamine 2-epimerase [Polyangiaceae bacterium]
MIVFFIGTIAELIKLFPVMKLLEDQGRPYKIIASGQNDLSQSDLMSHLKTPVSIHLHEGPIRQSTAGVLFWFEKTLVTALPRLRDFMTPAERAESILVLHGDTVSTLLGAMLGKLLGYKIAHVEAGLRSFKLFSPFPEEICRRFVSKLAMIHFCPNDWAVNNLSAVTGEKICTEGNTLIDSLNYSKTVPVSSPLLAQLEGRTYFIFVIHRQDNIYNESLVRSLIQQIAAKTKEGLTCLFIMHEPTRIAFESYGLNAELKALDNLVITPRLKYLEFMKVLAGADFLVTDGGSNQEECFYLGLPCLILRTATERTEGLDHNVILSHCDPKVIASFLADPSKHRKPSQTFGESPSQVIARRLVRDA